MPKNFVLATAFGTLLGVVLVFWTRPATGPGAVFLVVVSVLLAHVVATIAGWVGGHLAKPAAKTAERHD